MLKWRQAKEASTKNQDEPQFADNLNQKTPRSIETRSSERNNTNKHHMVVVCDFGELWLHGPSLENRTIGS